MFSKNFMVIIPDSNGESQVLPLKVSHKSSKSLDPDVVQDLCNVGIISWRNSDNSEEREDAIKSVLHERGYEVSVIVGEYTVITID